MEPPKMVYSDLCVTRLSAARCDKISAVKTFREVFDTLTLRSCCDLFNWPGGFLVTRKTADQLQRVYLEVVPSYFADIGFVQMADCDPIDMTMK